MLGNSQQPSAESSTANKSELGEFTRWFQADKRIRECEYQLELGLQMLRSKYTFTQLKGLSHLLRYIVKLASFDVQTNLASDEQHQDMDAFVNSQDGSGSQLFIAPVLLERMQAKNNSATSSSVDSGSVADEEFGILSLELLQALCVHSVMSRMLFVKQESMHVLVHIMSMESSSVKIIVRCLECMQCILSQLDYNLHQSFESCQGIQFIQTVMKNHSSNERIMYSKFIFFKLNE